MMYNRFYTGLWEPDPPPKPKLVPRQTLTVEWALSLLGIEWSLATREYARKRYRDFVTAHHPDLHPGDAGAESKMVQGNAAWALLQEYCGW